MFTDVESAALASDLVVLGTLGQPLQHLVDTGGATNGTGVPVLTYPFVLTRSSRGPAVTPASVTLVWTDTDKANIGPDDAVPLVPGRPYLLFLEQVPEADRGGLAGLGTLYVPVGMNAGVFPVQDGRAVATDASYLRVRKEDPVTKPDGGRLSLDPDAATDLPTATG